MSLQLGLLLAACAVAVVTDIRTRKIPNWLTAILAGAALMIHLPQGWTDLRAALAAGVVVFLLGACAHSMRILGGGDVKLLAAGALTVGYPDCMDFVLYTLIGGGVLALIFAALQRRLRTTLVNVQAIARSRTLLDATAPSARMPYAVAIALGALVVTLGHTLIPALRIQT